MHRSYLNHLADLKNHIKLRYTCARYGFKRLRTATFGHESIHKDTFFILGSGATINDLSPSDWAAISSGFSVGLNKWLIHDFIPDAISLEKNLSKTFYEAILNDRRLIGSRLKYIIYPSDYILEYQGFPYIINDLMAEKIVLFNAARNSSYKDLKSIDELHKSNNFWELGKNKLAQGLLLDLKGSIYRLTQIALLSGYKKIVYCGVDLINNDYFWDEGSFLLKRGVQNPNKSILHSNIHLTDSNVGNTVPISEIIRSLNAKASLMGVELSVASKKSKLADFLPIWTA